MADSSEAKPVARLLGGDVTDSLREMTVPMLVGLVAMILVNLIDTYWVSRLGTEALAAMTFTFPVEAVVINVALGLMIGTSVAVARAMGAGREDDARKLTTHATILAVGIVVLVSGAGLIWQENLFRLMGAEGQLLDNVQQYMTPWFVGVAFLVVPMIANGALRASGDAKTPMRVMVAAAALNAVLDPIFIFGWGPVPALELQGAAIATVIARFVTMITVFVVLLRKTNLLGLAGTNMQTMLSSWWTVGRVAGPAVATNAVGPFAVGILTTMLAQYGPSALAAWGIGARVDAVVLLVPNALSSALSPFVGQNWSAHLRARVSDAVRRALWFALLWGMVMAAVLMVMAPTIAGLFSAEPDVQASIVTYLRVMPIGYAFIGAASMCSSTFNAVDRATRSTVLAVLRSLALAVPLAWVGAQISDVHGLLLGLVVASIVSAILGVHWMRTFLYPMGDKPAGSQGFLTEEQARTWFQDHAMWAPLGEHVPALFKLDRLRIHALRSSDVVLAVGSRELLWIRASGALDLPLPLEVGENLARLGLIAPHPDHEADGWYQFVPEKTADVDRAQWLIGLSHLLYALSQRGAADPITQEEMRTYTQTPQCVAAMTAAAARWDAMPSGDVVGA